MSDLKKTCGSILVVSTLILSMLAGLSIATMQNVVTEYQLSTQDQDKNLALSAAHYALAEAKRLILTQWAPGATPCAAIAGCVNGSGVPVSTNGVAVWSYAAFAGSSDFAQQPANYFTTNAQATANTPNPKMAIAPRFFVVDLGCDPYSKANIYRIMAMGFGSSINTTAYAESQLTMPLSGQNSYTNAPTTAVYGVAVTANMAPTQRNYNLASSTNSKNLFFKNAGPTTCSSPGQSQGTGATCEMNCAGEWRVKAYSSFRNNNTCPWVYGDWMSGANQITLVLPSDSGSGNVTLSCGPCQPAMAVPASVCPISGLYNSCTRNCVTASCPAGQYSNNGACTNCPANTYSNAGSTSCTSCGTGTYSAAGASSCTACSGVGAAWDGSRCACDKGTWNGSCCERYAVRCVATNRYGQCISSTQVKCCEAYVTSCVASGRNATCTKTQSRCCQTCPTRCLSTQGRNAECVRWGPSCECVDEHSGF